MNVNEYLEYDINNQDLQYMKYLNNEPDFHDLLQEESLNNKPNSPVRNAKAHSILAYQEHKKPTVSSTHFVEHIEDGSQSVFFNTKTNIYFTLSNNDRRYSSFIPQTDTEKMRDRLTYNLTLAKGRKNKDRLEIKQARSELIKFSKSLRG